MASTKLPSYDPKDYPITEGLLRIYDLATRWAEESGETHRNTFRFACQFMETKLKNEMLREQLTEQQQQIAQIEQEKQRLLEEIKDMQAEAVILKALKEKRLFHD